MAMKLIVESGSTKSRWVLLNNGVIENEQLLPGINPTSNPTSISNIAQYQVQQDKPIKQVYFYGAGVSSKDAKEQLMVALVNKLGRVEIELLHDILAAARSMSNERSSVTSILGTGTNTVVFDGEKVVDSRKALGYLMGDFGSGYHIGKILIWKYFNFLMTEDDSVKFKSAYIEDGKDFIFGLYNSDKPNFEVASLSRFLEKCTADLRAEVLQEAFQSFVDHQIVPLNISSEIPLHFVGSISGVFAKELLSVITKNGLTMGDVSGDPMPGLIRYHTQ